MRIFLTVFLLSAFGASAYVPPPLDPYFDSAALEAAAKATSALKAAQRGEPQPAGEGFDQEHLDLSLNLKYFGDIEPGWCTLDGTAAWTLRATEDGLHAIDMELTEELDVTAVTHDQLYLDFERVGDYLTINLDRTFDAGETFTLVIEYSGIPPYGMYADTANGGIIHTFTEPFDASGWFPCYDAPDDRFTCNQSYTVRNDWLVASNGVLVSTMDNGDGTKTFNWEADFELPTYLVAMAASDYYYFYDTFNIGYGPQHVDNWVYQEHAPEAEEDLSIAPEMVEFNSALFTDYKYPRFGHMITEIGGAMEHTTTTTYSSSLITGDHTYDWVVVHELGHEWFGDWITCETWENIWLNEGFASYVEAFWAEHIGGAEGLRDYMAGFKIQYFNEDNHYRYPLYDPDLLFGTTVYKKGAWVLHMLRHRSDDETFLNMLREYVSDDDSGTVTTAEFIDVAEDYYGGPGSLDTFFDEWVYQAGYPEYDIVTWSEQTSNGWLCHVQLSQVQDSSDGITPEVFVTPVDLQLVTEDGTFDVVFDDDQREDVQTFDVPVAVSRVVFDPNGWLLYKLLSSDAPVVELTAVPGGDGVLVTWSAEGDILGVELYRDDGVGEVKLHSNELEPRGRFLDRPDFPGTYRYRLETVSADGSRQSYLSSWVDWRESAVPLALSAPWPCPAAGVFSVAFSLPETADATLLLYDLAGRRVAVAAEGEYAAGRHEVAFDSTGLPSGVYILKLDTDCGVRTGRVVIAR